MVDIYIRGGLVVTMDSKRRVIRDGAVAVSDGVIVDIGKREVLDRDYRYHSDIVVNAERDVIMPGLINTHVHLAQALLRGCADYLTLIPWLKDRVWVLQGNYKPDEALVSAQLAVMEMIKTGTTTFLETGLVGRYGVDDIIEFILKSGMRAAIARHVMDIPGYAEYENIIHEGLIETGEESLKDTLRLYYKYHGRDNRVWIWFGPRTPGAVSEELYREIAIRARELKTGITMHLAEIREDLEYMLKRFRMKPIEYVHSLGLTGSNVVLVHTVWIDESEIEILAKTKTSISHNPSSNAKLASGIAPVSEMLRRGVNVTLGTDGGPSNNTYDLIREMRIACFMQYVKYMDPAALRAEDVLEMATVNGARALMIDSLVGSIEKGKRADIIVIDGYNPNLKPSVNTVSHLVFSANGYMVKHSIIDGKLVMYDRRILTFDEYEVLEKADKAASNLFSRVNICSQPETRWFFE